ncbi:hypothetical protein [Streptomyces sp. KL116D]|uniref:hypothetical protein n=1 Tax=Streptomyces sp. KL116D TaxID=3045152 RepID=UPI00355876D9
MGDDAGLVELDARMPSLPPGAARTRSPAASTSGLALAVTVQSPQSVPVRSTAGPARTAASATSCPVSTPTPAVSDRRTVVGPWTTAVDRHSP